MYRIDTEVIINATPNKVWSVLLDTAAYPSWNPFIKKVLGGIYLGNKIKVTIMPGANKPMIFSPRITSLIANCEFKWQGSLLVPGLFDGEHFFELSSVANNATRLVHYEKFSGLLCKMVMIRFAKDTKVGFQAMNLALKNLVESRF